MHAVSGMVPDTDVGGEWSAWTSYTGQEMV